MSENALPPLKPANADNDGNDEHRPPGAPSYHMYLDDRGLSRLSRCELREMSLSSVGGGAAPQWQAKMADQVESITFSVLPVGWVGQWHESPRPQWVVPLSGRWFIQTQDGSRVEMGPGDVHFGEDVGGERDDDGHTGHLSGTVGDEPCVQMMIQLSNAPERGSPCRFH